MDDADAVDAARALEIASGFVAELPGGSSLAALINQWPWLHGLKAQAMLSELIDVIGGPEAGLVARIRDDPRVSRLIWEATTAAANADTNAKIRALARVVSRGIVDDAALDESRYLVDVIRELQVIDVRLLVALDGTDPRSEAGLDTRAALGVSPGVAESLNAKLLRLALVESLGLSSRSLHSHVRPSQLGKEVLDLLRQHGDGDPTT